jgi:hypothetical protein
MNDAKITAEPVFNHSAVIDKLLLLNKNLTNRLKECADDLENEINDRYGNTQNFFPSEKRRYDVAMKTVIDAREWIALSEKENKEPRYDDWEL